MKILIGLYRSQPGWQIVLQQEGLQYEIIKLEKPISIESYSVLIINDVLDNEQYSRVKEFAQNGGAVLFSSSAYAKTTNNKFRSKNIKYLVMPSDSIFAELGLIDFHTKFIQLSDKSFEIIDRTLNVQSQKVGKGHILFIPFDVNAVILDTNSIRKKIWVERKELPSEIVAKVSKGKIRKILSKILEFLYLQRDLPFVQLWQFPKTWKNLFMFRVDTDHCSTRQALEFHKICKKNNICGTWFVDTVSKETLKNAYKKMDDQEIALHCRRHLVFHDYKTNLENIKNGLEDLKEVGIEVTGFAAPFGDWNENLAKVLEKFDFDYSSEFTLDYDDLPFYPYIQGKKSSVLQIPIHPVSTGRLRRSHFTDEEKWQYFKKFIDRQIALNDPIFIYHHPSHDQLNLFNKVFEYINSKNINKMNYKEFSDWWKKRLSFQYELNFANDEINCNFENETSEFSFKISYNNKSVITAIKKSIKLDELNWKEPEKVEWISNLERTRKKHWRDILYNYESKKGKRNV